MKVYIYMSHCGELYVSDDPDSIYWTYCELCNDFDELLFIAESLKEVKSFLAEQALLKPRVYTAEHCEEILKDCEELFDEESEQE